MLLTSEGKAALAKRMKAEWRVIPGGLDRSHPILDGEPPRRDSDGREGTHACHRLSHASGEPGIPPRCGTRLQAVRHRLYGVGAMDRGTPAGERHDSRTGDDTLEISLVNDLRGVDGAIAQIEEFCAARNLAPGISFALNLAVDALLTGTITHGYDDDQPHWIEMIVGLEGEWLVVVMTDDGRAFHAWPALEPDAEALLVAQSSGAHRLFFARKVVEGVEYQRTNGCNVVTLTKSTVLDDGR